MAARWFYYRELLLLKKHERSEFIVLLGVSGACPPEQDHGVGIYHGSEKVPSVYPCLFLFKPLISFPPFAEIAPRLSLLSQKFEQSENIGQFS